VFLHPTPDNSPMPHSAPTKEHGALPQVRLDAKPEKGRIGQEFA